MNRSVELARQEFEPPPIQDDMFVILQDGPSVRVRKYVQTGPTCDLHVAELTAHEAGTHQAVVEAPSGEELKALLEHAVAAFSRSIRLRSNAAKP